MVGISIFRGVFYYHKRDAEILQVFLPRPSAVRFMGQLLWDNTVTVRDHRSFYHREGIHMKGYFTANGFYGLVGGRYILFASEADYYESMGEEEA